MDFLLFSFFERFARKRLFESSETAPKIYNKSVNLTFCNQINAFTIIFKWHTLFAKGTFILLFYYLFEYRFDKCPPS